MSNNKLHKGLGKSFSKMFGQDKVRSEFLDEENGNKEEEVQIDLSNKESNYSLNQQQVSQQTTLQQVSQQTQTSQSQIQSETKQEPSSSEKTEQSSIEDIVNSQDENSQNDSSIPKEGLTYIRTSLIQPNINQPRKNFDEDGLRELSESIQKYGVVEPLVVRKNGALYEIVAGERRWRAAKMAGFDKVPVVIKEYDNRTTKEVALIENIQRADLNPIEEALAYQSLIEEYGLTQEEVARRVSKNRSTVTNSLRILNLSKEIQELLKNGQLTQGHARALLSIENKELREKIVKRVVEENLSVREIEKLVRLENLSQYRDQKRKEQNTESMQKLKIILKDLERQLKHKFNTKVDIVPKTEQAGKIEIEYYTKDELDRLFVMLNGIGVETTKK